MKESSMHARPSARPPVLSLLVLCLFTACQRTDVGAGPGIAATPVPDQVPVQSEADVAAAAPNAVDSTAKVTVLPADFREYGATAFDEDKLCVVGAASNSDELAQRPYLVVKRADSGQAALWVQALSGIEGMYQTRATHCVHDGGTLYVLMQSDTHSQQTLSQTQLSVATIASEGGEASSEYVAVPGTQNRAYSAWVETGAENFTLRNRQLHVHGHYRFTDDRATEHDFDVALDPD